METLKINYNNNLSKLCEIGKKYDTDKSSQRTNVTDSRHCHPYTLFYDGLFDKKKDEQMDIAELGIFEGSSLLMWREYFEHSKIYGFDYDDVYINKFKENYDNDRIYLSKLDVTNKESIINTFSSLNVLYDVIIEDTTHIFEDQIRVIENIHGYLKPGGILIIEDIFKSYKEQDYIDRLGETLKNFQNYYFIELDHVNKNSTGWDNDKLFILIKNGAEPIFKNTNKLTIITPSYRINNLIEIEKSINFDYVNEWIIVYDGKRLTENPKLFDGNEKIREYIIESEGICGNGQRNYALDKITNEDALLYYLDDDNLIHPNLYKLLDIIDDRRMYTFDQHCRTRGDNIKVSVIDTANAIIPFNKCKTLRWILNEYAADGYYLEECYELCKNYHIYVNNDLCYYNRLRNNVIVFFLDQEYELML